MDAPGPVSSGARVEVTAGMFGPRVVEPVEVVCAVQEQDGVGFAYRALPGHPVNGEEAFILHCCGEDIHLTSRSLTRAAPQQPWRAPYPLLLLLQRVVRVVRVVRVRYLRYLLRV